MFHTKTLLELREEFATNEQTGLTMAQVETNLTTFGENTLPKQVGESFLKKVLHQFTDSLVLILITAAVISFAIGDLKDGIVISVIVIVNAIMGLVQQAKAEQAIAALQKLSVQQVKVLRDGDAKLIDAAQLVPGDILLIEAGDKIGADARLVEVAQLEVSESALTGESNPVKKTIDVIDSSDAPLGDRTNMVYKDSVVTFGRGKAMVVATGQHTEIGKISTLLQQQVSGKTPIELELQRVGKVLTWLAIGSAVIIFLALYFISGEPITTVFFTALSIAIAVVPEGIPTVVTTVLAIAVTKLAQKNAIVRKLSAVEALGSITHILTDKTGTLTQNVMTVTNAVLPGRSAELFESFAANEHVALLESSVLCNDSQINAEGNEIGDPTEIALLRAAQKKDLSVESIRERYQRVYEIPFSSETKRMVVVVKDVETNEYFAHAKGAPEVIFAMCTSSDASNTNETSDLAANGIRTLGFAVKPLTREQALNEQVADACLDGYSLLGVLGMKDPLRPEVYDAVATARTAGISTFMLTGDHKLIAQSIAKELEIIESDSQVLDGSELNTMEEAEYTSIVKKYRVFSRVSPEQKLNIVKAVQANGGLVAVTGDGVNDAPAIKRANIGLAMGIAGTDVTKEVADIVLKDDNYSTIISAVREGRVIFSNFVKFLRYQISCNLSGVFIIFTPAILGLAAPLLPIHILLLNLVSETGPSIALGLERGEKNVMNKPPRNSDETLLTKKRWLEIGLEAIFLTIAGLLAYNVATQLQPLAVTTAVLTTAFLSRLWHAFSSRSDELSIFSRAVYWNWSLVWVTAITLGVFMLAVYTSVGNTYLSTMPLEMNVLAICFALSLLPVACVELYKAIKRSPRISALS